IRCMSPTPSGPPSSSRSTALTMGHHSGHASTASMWANTWSIGASRRQTVTNRYEGMPISDLELGGADRAASARPAYIPQGPADVLRVAQTGGSASKQTPSRHAHWPLLPDVELEALDDRHRLGDERVMFDGGRRVHEDDKHAGTGDVEQHRTASFVRLVDPL